MGYGSGTHLTKQQAARSLSLSTFPEAGTVQKETNP
jgi:hypothetical protein